MLKTGFERFTASEAVEAGLIEAVNSGECKIECNVEIEKGELKITQRVFCFVDKNGELRAGKFKDDSELVAFAMLYYPDDEEEEEETVPELKDKEMAQVVRNILRKQKQ